MTGLAATDVTVAYGRGRRRTTALEGLDLTITPGTSLGIAGESGSGKTTAARVLAGLVAPSSGAVTWNGAPLSALPARGPGSRAQIVQLVFQDPNASLNQRMTVRQTLTEALLVNQIEVDRDEETRRLLDIVGLNPGHVDRYPFEFSGGQRQRIAIARAMAVRPGILIADEITSALDVSVQASLLNLLRALRADTGLALVVISHNLDVIRYLCDDVCVLYQARPVERADTESIFTNPRHPYTRTLLDAVPRMHQRRTPPTAGPLVDSTATRGCAFSARCPQGPGWRDDRERCAEEEPELRVVAASHLAACHFPLTRPVATSNQVQGGENR